MSFFIDGNNCQRTFGTSEKSFVSRVLGFAEFARKSGTIVFDGERDYPIQGSSRVKVIYSGYSDADSLIIDLISGYRGHPSEVILYTNDRELKNIALAKGARVAGSRSLFDLVVKTEKQKTQEKPTEESDVDELLAQMLERK
jgi:predicted RNA-binding protein with PIN domain